MSKFKPKRQSNQNPARDSMVQARSQTFLSRSIKTEPWRIIATAADLPIECLRPAEIELLDIIERVVIRGRGWGKKDRLRDVRDRTPLSPRKLSRHGQKKSPRTYQRAIRRLTSLGLLIHQDTGSDQVRVYSPAWWLVESSDEAVGIWRLADVALRDSNSKKPNCRSNAAPMTTSCHTSVAPPVADDSHSTCCTTISCEGASATITQTETEDCYGLDGKRASNGEGVEEEEMEKSTNSISDSGNGQ